MIEKIIYRVNRPGDLYAITDLLKLAGYKPFFFSQGLTVPHGYYAIRESGIFGISIEFFPPFRKLTNNG